MITIDIKIAKGLWHRPQDLPSNRLLVRQGCSDLYLRPNYPADTLIHFSRTGMNLFEISSYGPEFQLAPDGTSVEIKNEIVTERRS